MMILLTKDIIDSLAERNVTTLLKPGAVLPKNSIFEPPCSLKWMNVQHSLELGAFSYAVSGFYFACRIGRYCSFGEQVQIGRHPHPMSWISTSPFFYLPYKNVLDQRPPEGIKFKSKPFLNSSPPVTLKVTTIGNDVWIGHGAFILPGINIGDGAVIAAKSVVTKDVPPYAVMAGSPARIVRFRFPENQIRELLELKWWEFAPWQLEGSRVDDIPAFIQFLSNLRQSGEVEYLPERINLSEIDKI